jgi:DUF4097 and DUF4098 domain-containing protein YvlB
MTRRDFGLLLLILLLGAGVTIAHKAKTRLSGSNVQIEGLEFLEGPLHTFSESGEAPLAAGARLTVEAGRGDVEVMTWSEPKVRLELKKQLHREHEEEAEKAAAQVKLEVGPGSDGVVARVTGSRPTRLKSALTVMVPEDSRLQILTDDGSVIIHGVGKDVLVKTAHGDVQAAELGGSIEVVNDDGSIDLRRVKGPATLRTAHGDVSVTDHEGSLEINATDSDVILSRIAGPIVVNSSHGEVRISEARAELHVSAVNAEIEITDAAAAVDLVDEHGSVRVRRAGGDVRLNAPHCEVEVSDVKGGLTATVESDSLRAERVGGAVKIQASASEVSLTDVTGAIVVAGAHTPVEIVRPGSDVEVSTTNQDVRLSTPATSGFRLDARAEQGEVESDLEELHVPGDRPSHFAGMFGDGKRRYRLATSNATISVLSAPTAASKSDDDTGN